ncbi:piggybac transposable element-derived protein 4 [Holotrichia oblita]|uniref:Piggybac transposable element-derived protein 4 n=1 Tax=Holotrichia oblita TaxID=644536 RepID=A0ACB9T8U1_HOLOL|nr:piggybac transposable element-derived protein 4 [Holotrichia oblita]
MAKRKIFTDEELRQIWEKDSSDEEYAPFSSDDSIEDPDCNPSPNASDTGEEDEVGDDIEEMIPNLQSDEENEEVEDQDDVVLESRDAEVPDVENDKWTDYEGRHKIFTFTGKSGLQIELPQTITPYEAFSLFVDDEVINMIVVETNKYAEQKLKNNQHKTSSRINKWVPTNSDEIKKFLGLVLWMGLVKLGSIPSYWSTNSIYKNKVAAKIMSRNRSICEELSKELLNQGRTLYVDNFYTSYGLALSFLRQNTHVVGTLRANKKYMPRQVMDGKLDRGQMIAKEDGRKWSGNDGIERAEGGIDDQPSTSRASNTTTTRKRSKKNRQKPIAIIAYNKGKAGINLSDQMSSYATTLRKSVKWYRKLGIEYMLGISLVNAFVVYKAVTKQRAQIRWFREKITSILLSLLKRVKHNKPNCRNVHVLKTKVDENNKEVRRMCTLCYSKIKKIEGRIAAKNKGKRVCTYCPNCHNAPCMCLECFGNHHKSN